MIDANSTSITAILMWHGASSHRIAQPTLMDLWAGTNESDAQGFPGLVQNFSDMAEVSQHIWEEMLTIGVFNSPGVYDYEVSETFGEWFFGELNKAHPCIVPSVEEQKLALGQLIWNFFAQVPESLTEEQYAVITEWTGYTVSQQAVPTATTQPQPHVVVNGAEVFGPFENDTEAHQYAAQHLDENDDYTVKPIIQPNKA